RVPARLAFISARTASWTRCGLTSAPKIAASNVTCFEALPVLSRSGAWALALGMCLLLPHLDERVLRAGDGALDQQEAVLGVHVVDHEPDLRDALAAEAAGHLDAFEDARGSRRRADRARLADVVRAVRLRAAVEPVALDRAGEALADRDAGHLDRVAGLERLDGHGLADGQLGAPAELHQLAMRGDAVLRQVPDLALRELPLGNGIERELHGVVAVR